VKINENITVLPDHLFSDQDLKQIEPQVRKIFKSEDLNAFAHKIYLEDDTDLRRQILYEIHDTPVRGHPGISNTWNLVR